MQTPAFTIRETRRFWDTNVIGMLEYLAVGLGPAIILGVILYINAKQNVNDIKKNWVKYRCHPAYMPFVSMFQETATTAENFQFCINAFSKEAFGYVTDPIYQLFDMLTEMLNSFLGDITQFLKYIASIEGLVFSFADRIFGKIFNTFSVFTGLMARIRDLVGRITASAYYAVFTIQSIMDFVMAMFNFLITIIKAIVIIIFILSFIIALFFPIIFAFTIPLGAMMGIAYCFHPDTLVSTQNGMIPIKYINTGDNISGSCVTGVFKFECPPDLALYSVDGTIVSGRHLVLCEGTWKYVQDTGAELYTGLRPPYLVCLNMSDNIIEIGDSKFRDYEEVDTNNVEALRKIEKIVWNEVLDISQPPGIHPNTLVTLATGEHVKISDLGLGSELVEGCVSGIVRTEVSEWCTVEGCILSADQPVMHLGGLRLAREIGKPCCAAAGAYQIFIDNDNGLFKVGGGLIVRDYPDSHDVHILEEIQKVVMESLIA